MKKFILLILLLNQLLGQAQLKIFPKFSIISLNSIFDIEIKVNHVQNLFSIAMDLHYDSNYLKICNIYENDFLSENGFVSTTFLNEVDSVNGKIILGLSRIGRENGGVKTDTFKTLVTIKAKAIKTGKTNLSLKNIGLLEPDGSTLINFINNDTTITITHLTVIDNNENDQPSDFEILSNYPNPFNTVTVIPIYFYNPFEKVNISVYDVLGHKVKTLFNDTPKSHYRRVYWDGKDDYGSDVGSAAYFVRIKNRKNKKNIKVLLIK